jgi:hypothetical protein
MQQVTGGGDRFLIAMERAQAKVWRRKKCLVIIVELVILWLRYDVIGLFWWLFEVLSVFSIWSDINIDYSFTGKLKIEIWRIWQIGECDETCGTHNLK